MRVRVVIISLVFAAIFVGLGIFFLRQDLSTADQIASVGSFFVALIALTIAVISMLGKQDLLPRWVTWIFFSRNIQTGPNSVMNVTESAPKRTR